MPTAADYVSMIITILMHDSKQLRASRFPTARRPPPQRAGVCRRHPSSGHGRGLCTRVDDTMECVRQAAEQYGLAYDWNKTENVACNLPDCDGEAG
eukprot:1211834-Pyramimonas_sp.AAC.1